MFVLKPLSYTYFVKGKRALNSSIQTVSGFQTVARCSLCLYGVLIVEGMSKSLSSLRGMQVDVHFQGMVKVPLITVVL